jgi:hypothetical protein
MNERRFRRRVAVLVLVAVVATYAVTSGASAERDRRCGVAGFVPTIDSQSWTAVYTGDANLARIMGEWTSAGTTTLTCGNRILRIDVSEHASSIKVDPKGGDDDVTITGKIAYELTADFDGDGSEETITLDGRVSGEGVDRGDVVKLRFNGRGSSPDGSKIKLRHRGALDVRGEEWRDLEVRSGLFNPTQVSFLP